MKQQTVSAFIQAMNIFASYDEALVTVSGEFMFVSIPPEQVSIEDTFLLQDLGWFVNPYEHNFYHF